jgi:hypothetical protein
MTRTPNWIPFSGGGALPGPYDGYFVMSKTTWNGNLGGSLAAADALCLTELTTNTGWKGYAEALADGKLVSGNVHAFNCDHEGAGLCNNLNASTTYYFADANNSAHGGNSFTTDGSGVGPNNSDNWSTPSHFGGNYFYWSDRHCNTGTAWGTDFDTTGCACGADDKWDNGTSSYTGCVGQSNSTGNSRWFDDGVACNNTENLVCFVNP